jgi:hypothetical protein
MNKYRVQLTQWEVFTLFEELNTSFTNLYYEPQRYHQITFPSFYKFIKGEDFVAKMLVEKPFLLVFKYKKSV